MTMAYRVPCPFLIQNISQSYAFPETSTVSLWRGTVKGQHDSGSRSSTDLIVKRELAEPVAVARRAIFPSRTKISGLDSKKSSRLFKSSQVRAVASGENVQELSDEDDDDVCPAECVMEFKTDKEFLTVLDKAKKADSLVVVDFYRTSCGSCKYIEQIFTKLCKGAGEEDAKVVFLKHNVIDEYDQQSEVAERLRIKAVPLFHFYKNGALLEAFPTRDKERILAAISKYSAPKP